MGYREEYEAEIDLKDMLFYVLRRWRSILLAGLVLCVLFSTYKAVRRAGLDPEDLVPQKIKEYEYEMAQYELDKSSYERTLQDYTELLELQNTYMEKSVLMHTDPYNKPVALADVFVKLDSTEWEGLPANIGLDPTDTVLKAYTSNLWSTLNWEPIETLVGGEKIYLEELVGVSVDYNSNTFSIKVVHSDGEMAQRILDIVLEQVMDRQQDVVDEVGRHTLMVGNSSLSYSIDRALAESQRNNVSMAAEYEQSILNQRMKLEELEEPQKPFVIGFAKYPIVGFVLGAFLMAILYGVAYFLDGKLHGEHSLQDRYGYALLGVFPKPQRTSLLAVIDRFLDKLFGNPPTSEQDVCRRIALNLTNMTDENKSILLTGTVNPSELQVLADTLSQQLTCITLIVAPDLNLYVDTLKNLAECDAVLFAEKEEVSYLSAIQKEHEAASTLGKPVIGYVLL